MIAVLAWRNIWRSRTRSLVVIGSIVIGIWALVFLLGFLRGQVNNYITNAINNQTSHIQFHHPNFKEDFEPRLYLPDAEEVKTSLVQRDEIKAVTARVILNGMLSSSTTVQGVMAKGIDVQSEELVTRINDKILDGAPLDPAKRNQLLISQRTAAKLKVKLRSKVVMTFQNVHGDITTAAFRIVGIYKTYNKALDELYVFTNIGDLQRLTEMPDGSAHELAVLVNDFDQVDTLRAGLAAEFPHMLVETYKEISPDLELFNSQIKLNMLIMTTIFMLALIFGIINTMLMAVLERIKELGMLMAVGMNKMRVFLMVVLETIFISILGAPIGMLLGYMTIKYLQRVGIDLSNWSTALEEFGMPDVVRPMVSSETFLTITGAVVITALLASIYPAIKAVNLRPVQALRKL